VLQCVTVCCIVLQYVYTPLPFWAIIFIIIIIIIGLGGGAPGFCGIPSIPPGVACWPACHPGGIAPGGIPGIPGIAPGGIPGIPPGGIPGIPGIAPVREKEREKE